jgi:site-specific DNA-methyltransferase (adenine-specific)
MNPQIVIDPEFREMISPLRAEEREQLEANILAEGCRDPLVVWMPSGILLDGHNRHDVCVANGIEFKVTTIDLPDREAAADWIDANQLGRRNLTPDQYSLLRGRRYNRAKMTGFKGNQNTASAQNERKRIATDESLALQHGVSSATIRRDGEFADAIKAVKAVDPEIEVKVVRGNGPPKGAVVEAAKVIRAAQSEVKATASTPLIPTRKDRDAAEILENAKDEAIAILNGGKGTVAQARRAVARRKKREALEARAVEVEADGDQADSRSWQIITGDSIRELTGLEPGTARLVFADPPYNLGVDYGDHHDDNMTTEDYLAWSRAWIVAAATALTPDGSLWVLIGNEYADYFGLMLREVGLHRRSWIKWYESFGVNTSNNFNRCSRHLFYCVKDDRRFVFNVDAVSRPSDRQAKYRDGRADPGGKIWDDVWGINPAIPRLVENSKERLPDFPTQLPLQLLTAIVGCVTDPGDLVIDPFSGSGTTGEACVRLGRRYLGIEQSPEFAALSRSRLITIREQSNVDAIA